MLENSFQLLNTSETMTNQDEQSKEGDSDTDEELTINTSSHTTYRKLHDKDLNENTTSNENVVKEEGYEPTLPSSNDSIDLPEPTTIDNQQTEPDEDLRELGKDLDFEILDFVKDIQTEDNYNDLENVMDELSKDADNVPISPIVSP